MSSNRQQLYKAVPTSPIEKRPRLDSESKIKYSPDGLNYPNSQSNLQKVLVFCSVLAFLLIIMLWDMRQMHLMSEIIHDDHTGHWVSINESVLAKWYSPLDLCMLKQDESGVDMMLYRNDNCSKYPGVTSYVTNRLFCNVGSSIGSKPCYGPLTKRSFFHKAVKDPILGDPRSNQLRTALRMLARMHKPVVFVGDGLSRQNQDALICEMMRTDKVSVSGHYSDTTSNYTIKWRNSDLSLNVLYFKMSTIHDPVPFAKKSKFRILSEVQQQHQQQQIQQHTDYTNRRLQLQLQPQVGKQGPKLGPKQAPKMTPVVGMAGPKVNPSFGSKVDAAGTTTTGAAAAAMKMKPKAMPAQGGARAISSPASNPAQSASAPSKSVPLPVTTQVGNNATQIPHISFPAGSKTVAVSQGDEQGTGAVPAEDDAPHNKTQSSNHGLLTFEKIKKYVGRLVEENNGNGVVLVGNVGVYYNSREQFRTELPDLLGWMDHLSREANCTVFYRETAAQHWNHTESGYYDRDYDERPYNNGSCVPIADSTPEIDWRNTDVQHLIENDGYHSIRIIPFKDLTQPLYNMHPSGVEEQDCTNYCYFPQMWQIIWHELYKGAMGGHANNDTVLLQDYGRRRQLSKKMRRRVR